jgi:hypothetical protein
MLPVASSVPLGLRRDHVVIVSAIDQSILDRLQDFPNIQASLEEALASFVGHDSTTRFSASTPAAANMERRMLIAQVLAVQLKQVETIKEGLPRAASGQGRAQPLEVGRAPLIDHYAFSVDDGRPRRQRPHRFNDRRHAIGPGAGMPAEYSHPFALAPTDEPIAVMLDLVCPQLTRRRRAEERGVRLTPGRQALDLQKKLLQRFSRNPRIEM